MQHLFLKKLKFCPFSRHFQFQVNLGIFWSKRDPTSTAARAMQFVSWRGILTPLRLKFHPDPAVQSKSARSSKSETLKPLHLRPSKLLQIWLHNILKGPSIHFIRFYNELWLKFWTPNGRPFILKLIGLEIPPLSPQMTANQSCLNVKERNLTREMSSVSDMERVRDM